MTPTEIQKLIDAGVAYLKLTTSGYKGHTATWYANTTTNWARGLDKLAQARAALDTAPVIASPVGPFTVKDGGGTQESGVFSRDVGSPVIAKQQVAHFTGYGIGQMAWPATSSTGTSDIHDCIAEDIAANPPGSRNGTAEAGFWLGQRTRAYRLAAKRCAWMGMWTGARCDGSVIEDFELLEMPHVGLYVEHVTTNTVFRRGRIESKGTGVNVEWWYNGEGSHHLTFEDLDIYCPKTTNWTDVGMFLDAGSYGCTIRRCRFWGPGDAVWLPNKRAGADANIVDEASCKFENLGRRVSYHDNAIG